MQVEIWSDVMCPWCAVGKARFEKALAMLPDAGEVEVRWRSFELDPEAPREVEGEYAEKLGAKYGTSRAGAQQMIDRMTETAAAEGLHFDFGHIRPGNTFDAHRLLHLAAERGLQDALKTRLFEAYLSEGAAVGRPDVLQRLAEQVGLEADEVAEVLAGERYADAVRADERQAMAFGIRGVPFFVVDRRYGVSGAQPAEELVRVLRKAKAEETPPEPPPAEGCADDACEI